MTSEEVVFSAILRWIEHDPENRKDSLPGLLTCVRLPLLTPHFLSDKVAAVELIRSSHKCRYDENYSKLVTTVTFKSHRRDLLDEARDYHLMPERRPLLQSFKTKPRRCKDLVGVIYAVGGQTKSGNSLSTVEVKFKILKKLKWTVFKLVFFTGIRSNPRQMARRGGNVDASKQSRSGRDAKQALRDRRVQRN